MIPPGRALDEPRWQPTAPKLLASPVASPTVPVAPTNAPSRRAYRVFPMPGGPSRITGPRRMRW